MLQRTVQVFLMRVSWIQCSCCFLQNVPWKNWLSLGIHPKLLTEASEQIPKQCKKRWRGCALSQRGCLSSCRGVCQGGKSFWGDLGLCKGDGSGCSLQDRKVVVKRARLGQWGPSDNAWKTWEQKYAPLPSPSVTVSNGFYPSSFSSLFFSIKVLATIKTVLFPSACVSFQILIHTQSCRC